ncbi:hypothetical protein AaE_001059 [Aphanomyces astaci]|uniref:Uncharacterized protein n=1 Tax=Aphanomyces astaci TaxID=112090 RepID=A0A6A5AY69_APHAT|nr:hypothetical protein AaE_001059 [Aphanomyces astaci]
MPGWDTSPPQTARILVHQILAKPHKDAKHRKGHARGLSRQQVLDAKTYIMDLRREIDWRLACDADPIHLDEGDRNHSTPTSDDDWSQCM